MHCYCEGTSETPSQSHSTSIETTANIIVFRNNTECAISQQLCARKFEGRVGYWEVKIALLTVAKYQCQEQNSTFSYISISYPRTRDQTSPTEWDWNNRGVKDEFSQNHAHNSFCEKKKRKRKERHDGSKAKLLFWLVSRRWDSGASRRQSQITLWSECDCHHRWH